MSLDFSRALFATHIGSTFTASVPGQEEVPLAFRELTGHKAPEGAESFSLFFDGPLSPLLPQGTYPFTHPALPPFDMFIVPVGKTATGYVYEAVFTRYLNR